MDQGPTRFRQFIHQILVRPEKGLLDSVSGKDRLPGRLKISDGDVFHHPIAIELGSIVEKDPELRPVGIDQISPRPVVVKGVDVPADAPGQRAGTDLRKGKPPVPPGVARQRLPLRRSQLRLC